MSRLVPRRPPATAGVLVVLALVLGQWLHQQLPERVSSSRPFEEQVAVGDTVSLRTGDVEVLSVEGATSVAPAGGQVLVSPGVFVAVEFTFTPRGESSSLRYAALRDNAGRVLPFFGSSGRSSITCTGRLVDRPTRCLAVVEADPATVPGARIAVAPSDIDERWDSMAVIDLAATRQLVQKWSARSEPLELPEAGVMTRTEAS
ncbi:hypothetical protein H9L21_05795 [Aeromicrobium senzhongii]|uniref:Uncharacterized protein n=1 Tax=Aeromicrobium senzhongii TaxID=2663859 RepID=A0ABX6SYV5_9ACTN|nr:hypothetical protein [Aeromicrobium senzhongii]MTB87523.1 hypothetical protein [Aeromicrobium senzhongii]QNL95435.1 hypothetical protein H9L21_05795 [Aeromicrobium senzhongii]